MSTFAYDVATRRLTRPDRARVMATGSLARFALPRWREVVAE
jgi:hypothetical protein